MTMTLRAALLAAAGLLALPARAEEAGEGQIVVTATKKAQAEDAQDVAIAINAFDASSLERRQVRDLQGLTHAIPGVSLDPVGTFRGVSNWSIRGLGINSSIASIDPAVGTFVDGVYLGINPGAAFDLFDTARVEVLRGPQGTLFGRNTTGGAVLVDTADPESEWGLRVRLSGEGPVDGGRGAMSGTAQGTITGPLADGVAFRLGAYHNTDGGYFRNLANGGNMGKAETTILRGGLKAGTGPLTVTGKLEYLKTSGDGAPGQNHGLYARDRFDLGLDNEGFIRARSWFGSLRADYDLGGSKITNILGWRNFRQFTSNDIDSTPRTLFHSNTGLTQEQWSNELRWAGRVADAADLTVGGFWFRQGVAYEEDRTIPPNPKFYGGGRQKHEVLALFAQADWDLAPTLTLTAGLRWSQEDKDARVTFVRIRPECSVIAGTCPVTGTNPSIPGDPNGFADKRRWTAWSPKLGLSWQPADGVLAYASWSRGNRSGGYNLRITAPAVFLDNASRLGSEAYDAEKVDTYEAGLKLAGMDRRLTLNLAAYQTEVRGMQREVSIALSGGAALAQSVYNTADARIRGFEAEARFAATPQLSLSAGLGHIDARYLRVFYDLTGNNVVDAADRALALPRAPRWTWSLGAVHTLALGGEASLVSRVDFTHRSRYAYTDSNYGWVGASDNLDASLTWNLPVRGISLTVYGRNLLDQVQFGGDTQIPFGGPLSDGANAPFDPRPAGGTFSPLFKGRTVGAEVALAF